MKLNPIINGLLLCLALGLCSTNVIAQSQAKQSESSESIVRLKLTDGSFMIVDEAWETPQGIWYRQGGLSHLASKDRVKSIDRSAPAVAQTAAVAAPIRSNQSAAQEPDNSERPAWIYLVGGARVEADSVNESTAGVWYKRGSMAIFIERSRVDHIEREEFDNVADSEGGRERGWSTGSQNLDRLIRQNGNRYGVDPYLVFLVMEQESHFNTRVVSPKGARGLMQLMPGTSARFGVRRPHDPAQNISGGTRYLKQLLDRFNNRVDLVLASYNAGEGAVMKFGQRVPPYRETRNYVKRISYRYHRATARKPSASSQTAPAGDR
jgi:soluble lytic murein transglycosylase-like protein